MAFLVGHKTEGAIGQLLCVSALSESTDDTVHGYVGVEGEKLFFVKFAGTTQLDMLA